MRTATVEVYEFGELADDVKEKVLECLRNKQAQWFAWDQDYRATIDKFCKLFPVQWKSYDADGRIDFRIKSNGDFDETQLAGLRLHRYLMNNFWDDLYKPKYLGWSHGKAVHSRIQRDNCCVLTGFCADDDILQPIYEFLRKPGDQTFEYLLGDCMHAFAKAYRLDYEASLTDESLIDLIDANGYEFTKCGRLFTKGS
jgi:hypothetical protein